jgi:uncharacterized membrane protein
MHGEGSERKRTMVFTLAVCAAAVTLLLAGCMAGVFFAFSTSVMPGLDAINPDHAIRAMQSINRKILNPVFLTTFVGAPIAATVTGGLLLVLEETPAAILSFLAAAAYALGALAPTMIVNVPMNEKLDAVDVPSDAREAARIWSDYSPRWTRWNTLRGLFNCLSLLLIGLAIFAWGR